MLVGSLQRGLADGAGPAINQAQDGLHAGHRAHLQGWQACVQPSWHRSFRGGSHGPRSPPPAEARRGESSSNAAQRSRLVGERGFEPRTPWPPAIDRGFQVGPNHPGSYRFELALDGGRCASSPDCPGPSREIRYPVRYPVSGRRSPQTAGDVSRGEQGGDGFHRFRDTLGMLGRFAFRAARSRRAGVVLSWAFTNAPWLLPVRKVLETNRVLAFAHPRPAAPVHIVVVPKQKLPTLAHADPGDGCRRRSWTGTWAPVMAALDGNGERCC